MEIVLESSIGELIAVGETPDEIMKCIYSKKNVYTYGFMTFYCYVDHKVYKVLLEALKNITKMHDAIRVPNLTKYKHLMKAVIYYLYYGEKYTIEHDFGKLNKALKGRRILTKIKAYIKRLEKQYKIDDSIMFPLIKYQTTKFDYRNMHKL